jgi:methionyl-tRNA formyltransferase
MKILFFGSPKSAIPILESIIDSNHELVGVITQTAKPKGRDKKLTKTDVANYCIDKNINCHETDNLDNLFQNELQEIDFDIAIVVAFGQIVPSLLLDKPRFGWINLHYSLLPKLRGAAPVQWSILNGDFETGITWFQINEGLDTGPILLQKKIQFNDLNYEELITKLNDLATKDLDEFFNDIENGKIQKKEQYGEISYAPKLSELDMKIDWSSSVEKIKSRIKTNNEYLSAWSVFQGDKIKILSYLGTGNENLIPGQIEIKSKSVFVGSATNPLILGEVIPQGKKRMAALDWLNGVQIKENLNFD